LSVLTNTIAVKKIVTHFMLEVTNLLVVGLGDYLASRGKKVTEGSINWIMRLYGVCCTLFV
jgi:hypothetical protein